MMIKLCSKLKPQSAASYIVPVLVFSVLYNLTRRVEIV